MKVLLTAAPSDDTDLYDLRRLAHIRLSTIFVDAASGYSDRPSAGMWALTVLEALGKNTDVAGWTDHASDNLTVLPVWLLAHRTEWVIVPDAHLLGRVVGSRIVEAIHAGGANVLLAARPFRVDQTAARYAGHAPERVDWDALDTLFAGSCTGQPTDTCRGAADEDESTSNQAAEPVIRVPSDDWPEFLATCRRLLPEQKLQRVEAAYWRAWYATIDAFDERIRSRKPPHVEVVRAHLVQATSGAPNHDTAIAAIRGTQASFFTLGFNLRIAERQLLRTLADQRETRLTDADWLALRAYRDTQ